MAFTYLHTLDGRIRIKVVRVRGCAESARKLETQLAAFPGIEEVSANPITGNVLILYQAERTQQREILRALRRLEWLPHHGEVKPSVASGAHGRGDQRNSVSHRVAENLVAILLELWLQRALI